MGISSTLIQQNKHSLGCSAVLRVFLTQSVAEALGKKATEVATILDNIQELDRVRGISQLQILDKAHGTSQPPIQARVQCQDRDCGTFQILIQARVLCLDKGCGTSQLLMLAPSWRSQDESWGRSPKLVKI